MKLYVIAGEPSGDLHGANLMREIQAQAPNAEFRFWGGDKMAAVAGDPVKHIKDLAFMGFVEVAKNLKTILRNMKYCKEDIEQWQPDAVILIDYPGFNLRIAEFVKKQGIKVLYYISPQVWAWKQSRVHKIKRLVDEMFVILPFEEAFYDRFEMKVHFVGHPLLDEIHRYQSDSNEVFRSANGLDDRPIVALLPGSRRQEIKIKLPIMLSVLDRFPDYQFVVAGAPSQDESYYRELLAGTDAKLVNNSTYGLLAASHAALVTSGTATLETALFNVPEVVCYKGGQVSYQIAKRLVKVEYISLVNLIMEREVVKELIQAELNTKNLVTELGLILGGPERERMIQDYDALKTKLGGEGASAKAATLMLKTLSST